MAIFHVSSHRRSGTHALIDLIRQRFGAHGRFHHLEEIDETTLSGTDPIVIKSHEPARGQKRAVLGDRIAPEVTDRVEREATFLYVHRDPYDVLKSLYFFNLAGHEPLYAIPPDMTFPQFLLQTAVQDATHGENRVRFWCRCVRTWINDPGVLSVTFDDVTNRPEAVVAQIARASGCPPLPPSEPASSTAIGRGTTAEAGPADLWTCEALDIFRAHVNSALMRRLGYRYR